MVSIIAGYCRDSVTLWCETVGVVVSSLGLNPNFSPTPAGYMWVSTISPHLFGWGEGGSAPWYTAGAIGVVSG